MDRDQCRLAVILAATAQTGKTTQHTERRLELTGSWVGKITHSYGGNLLRAEEDTFLTEFPSAQSAVQAAVALQQCIGREPAALPLGIGVQLGDIWFVGGELLGDVVEEAQRLQHLAPPGEICVSSAVLEQVQGRIEISYEPMGKAELGDIDRAVEVYKVHPTTAGNRAAASHDRRWQKPPAIAETPGPTTIDATEVGDGHRPLQKLLDTLVERGILTRLRGADGRLTYDVSRSTATSRLDPAAHRTEQQQAEEERRAARANALRIHAFAFAVVNALTLLIWALFTPGGHPWFVYPLGGWAIGLASHAVSAQMRRRHDLEQLGDLTVEQRRVLKKLQKSERGFAAHLTAFVSTSVLMLATNLITSPAVPWFLFAAGGWGVGVLSHRLFHVARRKALLRKLQRLGIDRSTLVRIRGWGVAESEGRYATLVRQAQTIHRSLQEQLASSPELNGRWGSELLPLLRTYLGQIEELSDRRDQLDEVLALSQDDRLEEEIRLLTHKRDAAEDPSLRHEYEQSIGQVQKQHESFRRLVRQKEIVELRLRSALVTLKKLQMDFAHVIGLESLPGRFAIDALRQKSDELSLYLADLESGYRALGI